MAISFLSAVNKVAQRCGIVQGASAITGFTGQPQQTDIDIIIMMWNEVLQDLGAMPRLVPGLTAQGGITLVNGLREYAPPTGSVTGYTVTAPGNFFVVPPTVAVDAPPSAGSQATAKAFLGWVSSTSVTKGTGYKVGDVLVPIGGTTGQYSNITPSAPTAQMFVTSIDGNGGVVAVGANHQGSYSAIPSNPVSFTGGSGSGYTANMTWGVSHIAPVGLGSGYQQNALPNVTFTGAAGTGATATPIVSSSELIKMITNPVNRLTLGEYPGGFEQMVIDQPDPTVYQGLPLRWCINPVTGNVRFDFTPTAAPIAGSTFPVFYVPRVFLQNTTDTFPVSDTVVDELVEAVKMKFAKERQKGDWSREEYMGALSDAARYLVREPPRSRYGVSRRAIR